MDDNFDELEFEFKEVKKLPNPTIDTMDYVYVTKDTKVKYDTYNKYLTVRNGEEGNYKYTWAYVGTEAIPRSNNEMRKRNNCAVIIALLAILALTASFIVCVVFGIGNIIYMFKNSQMTITQVIIEKIVNEGQWKWLCILLISYITLGVVKNKLDK